MTKEELYERQRWPLPQKIDHTLGVIDQFISRMDGKGFNEGFAELNFGGGAMMRLPITYQVEAWRPLADVINELSDHGVITTSECNED